MDFYSCSTYTLTFERETQMCSSHTVSTKALNALILETIRTTASYAIQNKEEFIQKVRSISQVRQQEAAKELKRKVAKERKRSAELDVLIKKLYETYAMGKLEEKRFELLCAEYEKEQAELEQLLASEQAQLDQFHEDTDRASHFLALAQKYTDFTELTAPMIHEFVEKILVHAPDRSTGERVQEIEIYLNFIGKFEVPICPNPPRKNWLRRKSAARSASVTMKSICARRSANRRLPKGSSFRVNRTSWYASAAESRSSLSAPTLNSANPPAGRSSTGRKSGKPKKRKHHKLHKDCGLPQQTGQAAFFMP